MQEEFIQTRILVEFADFKVDREGYVTYYFKAPYDQTPFMLAFHMIAEKPAVQLSRQLEGDSIVVDMGPAEYVNMEVRARSDYTLIFKSSLFDMLGIEKLKELIQATFYLTVQQLTHAQQADVTRRYFRRAARKKKKEE